MEMISASLHKSAVPGGAAKEENKASESDSTGKKSCGGKIVLQLEDKLVSAKSEMDEVMEENQRLRMCLNRILEDYRTLEMQYRDAIQQEAKKCPTTILTHQDQTEEPELIALSLGRTSSGKIRDERNKMPTVEKSDEGNEGLTLGLDCKLDVPKMLSQAETTSLNPSPENSLEEVKEEEGGESTRKTKAMNNAGDGGDHDEILQQNPVKRARVSVRVRCDTPTMNDGCQWRKYGQKIAKGNPCPRAYYRCTVAPSCPVRKQVQRCVEDMSVLITTYEGTHNHPLSVSATAMASTTSAAASMLLSGSSTSGGPGSSSTTSNLNGLNFYLSDNSRSKPFYLPNSSISSSSSYPTITLDLTSSSSSSSSHLSRLGNFPPRYPTMNLNFSSSQSSALPVVSWSNNGILGYGTQPCSKNQSTTSLSFQANPNETLYQSYLQKNTINPNQQTLAPDTIAAATKAITLDPSFQSALAAALSSIIGSGGTNNSTTGVQNVVEKSKHSVKSSDPFPTLSSFPSSTTNVKKCSPCFLERSSSSTSSQLGGLTFLSPSFPLSNSKSKSNSPGDDRDELI